MTAKLQEGGSLEEDKSQSDKNCGDHKKSEVTTPCQCVCHSKANRTTATAATPDTVDLTVSPCKETAQPPPPAPEHSKYLSVLQFINGSICNIGHFQQRGRDLFVLVLFYGVCTKSTCKQRYLWYQIKISIILCLISWVSLWRCLHEKNPNYLQSDSVKQINKKTWKSLRWGCHL